jgi:hypothetical protein
MENIITDTNNEECQELKNIKYKTMLLNGKLLHETKSANDLSNLDKFLENEKNNNVNEPWCKLNKTTKIMKIMNFIDTYKKDKNLDEEETLLLTTFLKDSIDKKKLARIKDVNYDKINGIVKDIPCLIYTKSSKHFTIKNMDKRISTLKSLAPKKVNGTIRNKIDIDKKNLNDSNSDSDEDL